MERDNNYGSHGNVRWRRVARQLREREVDESLLLRMVDQTKRVSAIQAIEMKIFTKRPKRGMTIPKASPLASDVSRLNT